MDLFSVIIDRFGNIWGTSGTEIGTMYFTVLHWNTVNFMLLNYTTVLYTTLQHTTPRCRVQCTTLQYNALHYSTIHYTTQIHYTTEKYTSEHYKTVNYILECTEFHWTPLYCTEQPQSEPDTLGVTVMTQVSRKWLGNISGDNIWAITSKCISKPLNKVDKSTHS